MTDPPESKSGLTGEPKTTDSETLKKEMVKDIMMEVLSSLRVIDSSSESHVSFNGATTGKETEKQGKGWCYNTHRRCYSC